MKKLFNTINNLITCSKWNNNIYEICDKPDLLLATVLFVIKEMLSPNFKAHEFANFVCTDSQVRECFRLSFYETLLLRKHAKKQTKSEKDLFVSPARTNLEWWEKQIGDNFAIRTPIFDNETLYNVVFSKEFLEEENPMFWEMFAVAVTYALSEENANSVLDILRIIVESFETKTDDAIARNLKPLALTSQLTIADNGEPSCTGSIFIDKNDGRCKVFLGIHPIGDTYERCFFVIDDERIMNGISSYETIKI